VKVIRRPLHIERRKDAPAMMRIDSLWESTVGVVGVLRVLAGSGIVSHNGVVVEKILVAGSDEVVVAVCDKVFLAQLGVVVQNCVIARDRIVAKINLVHVI
jgi:hypothetical protein